MRLMDSWLTRNASSKSVSLIAGLLTMVGTSVVNLLLTEPRHPKTMELWHEVQRLVADFFHGALVVRKRYRTHKRLQVPQVTCLPLV
jgi:hypothetical protein